MKSKEEIEYLAANLANPNVCKTTNWIEGYTQCQEDIADNMVKLANYLRNNYQPLSPNQAEWQRIKDKKVLRIEDIIDELNKQD